MAWCWTPNCTREGCQESGNQRYWSKQQTYIRWVQEGPQSSHCSSPDFQLPFDPRDVPRITQTQAPVLRYHLSSLSNTSFIRWANLLIKQLDIFQIIRFQYRYSPCTLELWRQLQIIPQFFSRFCGLSSTCADSLTFFPVHLSILHDV